MDAFDLDRFVRAQDRDGIYERALGELTAGRKQSHWMWFVFPQLAGLGRSETARRYAISGRAEAEAYLAHDELGPRLLECAQALAGLPGHDPVAVLGGIDAQKLQSCMTLFAAVDDTHTQFREVLDQYFGGREDQATLRLLD